MNKLEKGTARTTDRDDVFDVSILGLGAMGARMAQAFIDQGKRVAVWNRSPGKACALEEAGAYVAASAEAALRASPVSILVLLDNVAVQDVFWSLNHARTLTDRTIVNFTTNTIDESKALQLVVEQTGGRYVKGAIVAYPRNIGHPESHGIYSGNQGGIMHSRDLLEILTPNVIAMPWEEASAFSVMLHVHAFAAMVSFHEAVAASNRFGMPPSQVARLMHNASRFFVSDAIDDAAQRLASNDFDGDQARLLVHASAFEYLAQAMHRAGAATPIFDSVCKATKDAEAAGFGDKDIAAMAKFFASHPMPEGMPS